MRHRSISKFCLSLGLAVSATGGYGFLPLSLLTATTLVTIASPNAAQASILSSWEYNPSTQELEVMVPGGTTPRFFLEAEPARIVLELPGTNIGTVSTQQTYGGTIREIRVAQFETGITRIVLELAPGTVLAPGHAELRPVSGSTSGDRWVLRPLLATGASIASSSSGSTPAPQSNPATPALPTPDPTTSIANSSASSSSETSVDALPPLEPGATEIPVEIPAPAVEPDAVEPDAVAIAVPTPEAEDAEDAERDAETTETTDTEEAENVTTEDEVENAAVSESSQVPEMRETEESEEASAREPSETELPEAEASEPEQSNTPTSETEAGSLEAEPSDVPSIATQPNLAFPSPTAEVTTDSETTTETTTETTSEAPQEATPSGIETALTPSREAEAPSSAESPSPMLPPPDFSALPSVAPAPLTPAPIASTLSELPPSSSTPLPSAAPVVTAPPSAPVAASEIATAPPQTSTDGDNATSPANSPAALVTAVPQMPPSASPASIANRSIEFGQPLPPSAFGALPSVTPNLAAAPSQVMPQAATNSIRIPSGTVLNVRYPGDTPLQLAEGQSRQEVLVLSQAVQDASGKVVLPEGSYVIGRFEAQDDGNLFVAQAISLGGRNVLLRAQSEPLAGDRQLNGLWQNSALGVAAGLVLGGITGIGLIPAIAAGAATSAATTYVTAPQSAIIQPDQILEIRLTEDLNWVN